MGGSIISGLVSGIVNGVDYAVREWVGVGWFGNEWVVDWLVGSLVHWFFRLASLRLTCLTGWSVGRLADLFSRRSNACVLQLLVITDS